MSIPAPQSELKSRTRRAMALLEGDGYVTSAGVVPTIDEARADFARMGLSTDKIVFWTIDQGRIADKCGLLPLAWSGKPEPIIRAMRMMGLAVQWDGSVSAAIIVSLVH